MNAALKTVQTIQKRQPRLWMPIGGISTITKLVIQFVAVATAAPLVRIGRLLISVGYSHGTPSMPIPKEM